jgi:hypothetical protein
MKEAAAVELNFTAVAPVKLVPVITTEVPTGPEVGVKLVTNGVELTVKEEALAAETPLALVTVIVPVVVPVATTAVIEVAELTMKEAAAVELNFTAVAPVKLVPVITTEVPTGPEEGVKLVTNGVTEKDPVLAADVPLGVVTVIGPVVVPVATTAVIEVAELTV